MVRSARPDDAGEVARLAEVMYRSLGIVLDDEVWERWRVSARAAVSGLLGAQLTVVVAEDPGAPGRLVACGAGVISLRLPNPSHASARVGYVQWMSTERDFRRRGFGRAVLRGLLEWFESQGVDNVELHASADGKALYRSEGFWEGSTGLALRRRPWDPVPGP
ncbi:MAG TPA: GNAT family N-acetyltransferase [Acidimicrobiales bacterium]|nr:GNAT family N-acetyltransferase [Acidimicrobiales bacterium]